MEKEILICEDGYGENGHTASLKVVAIYDDEKIGDENTFILKVTETDTFGYENCKTKEKSFTKELNFDKFNELGRVYLITNIIDIVKKHHLDVWMLNRILAKSIETF